MNPYHELVAVLFRRLAAGEIHKRRGSRADGPRGAGSPAEPLGWGARLIYDAPVGALLPLRGLEQ